MPGNAMKTCGRPNAEDFTLVFGCVEHRALDVAVLMNALPRLCGGVLTELVLGTSSRGDTLVCVARPGTPLTDAARRRLQFWTWRVGGTVTSGGRPGRAALRACDLVLPKVAPGSLGAAAQELLGRYLVASPEPSDLPLALRLSLAREDAIGLAFDRRSHALFVPSPRLPPLGEEMSLEFRLPDGEVLGSKGVVTRVRAAGEDGPGTPAGFAMALSADDQRLIEALEVSASGIPGLHQRRAPRYPVRALARLTSQDRASGDDAQACVENLSQGGAFVRTRASVPVGTRVRLELDLPGGSAAEVTGTAVHCSDRGIGICFEADQAGDVAIGRVLERVAVHRRRALVIDDDSLCRQLAADELTAQGFEVFSASDGVEGIHSLMDLLLDLDLLLLDLHMPALDGAKLLELVREPGGERDLTIVVMSADEDVAVQQRLAAAGADAVLPKSDGMAGVLDAAVQTMLRREQSRVRAERGLGLLA